MPDHAQLRFARLGRRGPGGEQLVEHRVERLLRRVPRLEQVVVHVHHVDRIDGGLGIGVGREEHPPRGGEQVHRRLEELNSVHPRHPVVRQHHRDRVAAQLDLAQRVERGRAGLGAHDPVLVAVAPAQVACHRP